MKRDDALLPPDCQPMTTARYVKDQGFNSLAELVELSGWPRSTLIDMYANHPVRFDTVIFGCEYKKKREEVRMRWDLSQ